MTMKRVIVPILLLATLLLCGCVSEDRINEVNGMRLTSPAFKDNGMIPSRYTCQGEDVSPPLEIFEVPEDTMSLALIVDDPDAPIGTWVHWVVWNIPAEKKAVNEGEIPGKQGMNDFGKPEYGGPCPPSGTDRYYFKLYALDSGLQLPEGSTKDELLSAMEGHVLGKTELVGRYRKS